MNHYTRKLIPNDKYYNSKLFYQKYCNKKMSLDFIVIQTTSVPIIIIILVQKMLIYDF